MKQNRRQTSSLLSHRTSSRASSCASSRYYEARTTDNRVKKLRLAARKNLSADNRQGLSRISRKISAFANRLMSSRGFLKGIADIVCGCRPYLWHEQPSSALSYITHDVIQEEDAGRSREGSAGDDESMIDSKVYDEKPVSLALENESLMLKSYERNIESAIAHSRRRAKQIDALVECQQKILSYVTEITALGLPELEEQACLAPSGEGFTSAENDFDGSKSAQEILIDRRNKARSRRHSLCKKIQHEETLYREIEEEEAALQMKSIELHSSGREVLLQDGWMSSTAQTQSLPLEVHSPEECKQAAPDQHSTSQLELRQLREKYLILREAQHDVDTHSKEWQWNRDHFHELEVDGKNPYTFSQIEPVERFHRTKCNNELQEAKEDFRELLFQLLHEKEKVAREAQQSVDIYRQKRESRIDSVDELGNDHKNLHTESELGCAMSWCGNDIDKLKKAEEDLSEFKRHVSGMGIRWKEPDHISFVVSSEGHSFHPHEISSSYEYCSFYLQPDNEAEVDYYDNSEYSEDFCEVDRERIYQWMDNEEEYGASKCDFWEFREVTFGESCDPIVADGQARQDIDCYEKMRGEMRPAWEAAAGGQDIVV